jgi:Do/DeqQ family serine protease
MKTSGFYRTGAAMAAGALIMLFVTGVFCKSGVSGVFGNINQSPLRSDRVTADMVKTQEAFRKVFELNRDSVVYISTEQTVKRQRHPFFDDPFFRDFFPREMQQNRTRKVTGLGTGFIISEDGYICTNFHVVNGVDKVNVKVAEDVYRADIIGLDERTDLALLKIKPNGKLKPVYFGNSDNVSVGDWAIAIGNPFGLSSTFTVGVVSATGRRDLDLMGDSQSHIQTDASINPGNSGGPLLNIYGEVIGINHMIYSQSGGNVGLGFAIPINTAKSVLEQLKQYKKIKRGYIGVRIAPMNEETALRLGLQNADGAFVGQIIKDSPAEKGGIIPGDVILSVSGRPVKNYGDLVSIVDESPVGETLKVEVWRKKSKLNLFIKVAERP